MTIKPIMKLYHTAYLEIQKPDIRHGRKNADLEQGFYLTDDAEFAKRWASEKKGCSVYVNRYELSTEGLRILTMERCGEWSDYIFDNRALKPDKLAEYDAIFAPIANDTLYETMGIITSGYLSRKEALELLLVGGEYRQLMIKSDKAAAALRWLGSEELPHEDIRRYKAVSKREEEEYQERMAEKLVEMETKN